MLTTKSSQREKYEYVIHYSNAMLIFRDKSLVFKNYALQEALPKKTANMLS